MEVAWTRAGSPAGGCSGWVRKASLAPGMCLLLGCAWKLRLGDLPSLGIPVPGSKMLMPRRLQWLLLSLSSLGLEVVMSTCVKHGTEGFFPWKCLIFPPVRTVLSSIPTALQQSSLVF